jgi:hypothetical protein
MSAVKKGRGANPCEAGGKRTGEKRLWLFKNEPDPHVVGGVDLSSPFSSVVAAGDAGALFTGVRNRQVRRADSENGAGGLGVGLGDGWICGAGTTAGWPCAPAQHTPPPPCTHPWRARSPGQFAA